MNKLIIPVAMSLMLLSTSAMALTININKNKSESERPAPPPPSPQPPPPPPPPPVKCVYSEPQCDRHDRIHPDRYETDQKKYSRGQCIRGEKERNFDFYCSNGDAWMRIDYRRNQPDRIECMDQSRGKYFAVRSIRECEDLHRDAHKAPPPRHHHHHKH